MALHRGIQSALFYYLACTPCGDRRYRKKRKKQAERDRADKELLEAQMPNLYRQPSPSSTNPFWDADIALGPAPPVRGGKRKATPNTAGSRDGNGKVKPIGTGLTQSNTGSTVASNVGSTVSVGKGGSPGERFGSSTSFRQQQRVDEELWGSEVSGPPLRSFADGADTVPGLQRPAKAKTRDMSSYESSNNPSPNDLHPATTRKVSSRDEIAWMMQPPPTPDVMSGKVSPLISRTASHASSKPSLLSRQSSNRRTAARVPSAESAVPPLPVALSDGPQGQRHDRDSITGLPIAERDFAAPTVKRVKSDKRRPSPIEVLRDSEDSDVTIVHRPSLAADRVATGRVASRPQLSTILSDDAILDDEDGFYTPQQTPKENRHPSTDSTSNSHSRDRTERRAPLLVHDSSLKVLQSMTPRHPVFNTKMFATTPAVIEAKIRLPAQDGEEERRLSIGPEMFDSWATPDFQLGEWVHQHTKREGIRHRWSMDI